jgi:hypothetical protein
MGLLMSDTMPSDPMLDDAAWMRESVSAWVQATDAARDPYEYEAADRSE